MGPMPGSDETPENLTRLPDGTLTLADRWPGPGDTPAWACIVGGKTSPGAIATGHFYAGPIGRRQLSRLAEAGLYTPQGAPFADLDLAAQGIGCLNLSREPRSHDDAETLALMREGAPRAEREMARRKVELVISMWRHGTRELLGHEGRPGVQERDTAWGAVVFRMPSPYERAVVAQAVMDDLSELLRELGRGPLSA